MMVFEMKKEEKCEVFDELLKKLLYLHSLREY